MQKFLSSKYYILPFNVKFNYFVCTVLEKIKPSVIIHLRFVSDINFWVTNKSELMEDTGLSYREIWENDGHLTLFVYAKDFLEETVSKIENTNILKKYGYSPKFTLSETLDLLVMRYNKNNFPHEIGVFLGYPAKDVLGFIENNGKNYILSKYWKVYGDMESSIELFNKIDFARYRAAHKVMDTF